METKFFSEIEKKMDVKTIKDFEKEVRTKIYSELETLRKKNDELNKILHTIEMEMWSNIRNDQYSWLVLSNDKKKKLFRLIDIYTNFSDIIDNVKSLNKKIEKVKQLKDIPIDESTVPSRPKPQN